MLLGQDAGRSPRERLLPSTASISPHRMPRQLPSGCSTRCRSATGVLLAASGVSPPALPLREDLRTRLGWGLVYEIFPLDDAEKARALAAYAAQRGLPLGDDVVGYLLAHGRRDMRALLERFRRSIGTRLPPSARSRCRCSRLAAARAGLGADGSAQHLGTTWSGGASGRPAAASRISLRSACRLLRARFAGSCQPTPPRGVNGAIRGHDVKNARPDPDYPKTRQNAG
jgi:hypothetical protein